MFVLLLYISGSECIYVCLWMLAHTYCGRRLVCVPYVSCGHMPCMGILTHACVYLLVYMSHPCTWGWCCLVVMITQT